MKSLAAILVEQKKPLAIEEVETPKLGHGQALVKVLCTGICGSQIGEIDGVKGPDRFLPHLLGHEGAGIVLECGPGVTTVREGDRVVLHWRKGGGLQSAMPTYRSDRGPIHAGSVTTFNEYAVVSENRITAAPDDLDPGAAALMGCAVTTGFGVVNNDARLKIGESIVVYGVGGVGLSVVYAAGLASAFPIIAVDLHDNRLEVAKVLGATHLINAAKAEAAAAIRAIVGEEGADVVVENTGDVRVIEEAYELTSARGRTILVGVPRHDAKACLHTLPLHFEKGLLGSHGGQCRPDRDIPRYARLAQAGRLNLQPMITRRRGLEHINGAIAEMRRGEIAGRCILEIADG